MRTQAELEETEREADLQAQESRPLYLMQHTNHEGEADFDESCKLCRKLLEDDIARADGENVPEKSYEYPYGKGVQGPGTGPDGERLI